MTRIRTSHSWRTIRGMRIRIAHRRRAAVKLGSSILRPACQGMATYGSFLLLSNVSAFKAQQALEASPSTEPC
jgi:hypothetical protein